MVKKFKHGDRVYHRSLKQYGTFIDYAWESEDECDVDFETEDGKMEQKHVSVSWLESSRKTYNNEVMKALRKYRGLEPGDTSQDIYIMNMAKKDVFNAYCQWNGLIGGYGYKLLNVMEDIYDINLQKNNYDK